MNEENTTPNPVRPREIADLLARACSLTDAGPAADPAERGAYLTAKADLLARIAATSDDPAAAAIAAHAAVIAAHAAEALTDQEATC